MVFSASLFRARQSLSFGLSWWWAEQWIVCIHVICVGALTRCDQCGGRPGLVTTSLGWGGRLRLQGRLGYTPHLGSQWLSKYFTRQGEAADQPMHGWGHSFRFRLPSASQFSLTTRCPAFATTEVLINFAELGVCLKFMLKINVIWQPKKNQRLLV